MTNAKPVHITFLLDRSGSMSSLHSDVVGGFNSFLTEQKAQPGKACLTLVQFDSGGIDTIHDAVKLADVPEMKPEDFQPRSSTPLLDAIGRTVASVQARIDSRKSASKKDEVNLVVIYTDGQENSSHEFTKAQVKALVEAKTAEGWTFAYMGSDLNAYDEAGSIGISVANTSSFDNNSVGTQAAYASVSTATSNLRSVASTGATPDAADFYKGNKADKS